MPSYLVFLLLFLHALCVFAADFYKALGGKPVTMRQICTLTAKLVSKSASDADIRKAYKKLSRKYHPDKNKEPGAEQKFVEVARGESLWCAIVPLS